MQEYTFLLGHSFRSEHVKAKTLREAWSKTKKWYAQLSQEEKERAGSLVSLYQFAREGAYVMSRWLETRDKKITGTN